ncbi:hypothetical protein F5B17DRAFT_72113 [Nemania serpens]|nr:hypothetical protein F5B17DRAFT_72113 [Nemania serpens]
MEIPAMLNEAAESAKNGNNTREEAVKIHKRAISSPGPSGINSHHQCFDHSYSNCQTHASSQYSTHPGTEYNMERSGVSHLTTKNDHVINCMFSEDCDTGSVPRKAISHIFGRNKVCTRMIPEHVWVHYCRKHYQRTRYHSAQEYSKTQCHLVLLQIRLIHEWSEENRKNGKPEVVKNWTLSMRKREQIRVEGMKSNKRRRVENDDTHYHASPIGHQDNAEARGTGVPEWLRSKCRDGYTTEEIEAIIFRLQEQIVAEKRSHFPDIEILPNIPIGDAENARPRQLNKRRTANSRSHKQSQSLGVNTFSSPRLFMKEQSDPSSWSCQNFSKLPPATYSHPHPQTVYKEHYPDCTELWLDEAHSRDVPIRGPLPTRGPLYRPMDNSVHCTLPYLIPQSQESRARETCYDSKINRGSQYGYNEGPLPAPTHQMSRNAPVPISQNQSVVGPSCPINHTPHSEFPSTPSPSRYMNNFFQTNGTGRSIYASPMQNYDGVNHEPSLERNHRSIPVPNPPSTPYEHNWTPHNYTYSTPERGHSQHTSIPHAPNYAYHYSQASEAINGHLPCTPRAQIPYVVIPGSGQARSFDNHPYYNQASPVVNGHYHFSPQIQIPRVATPGSSQARSFDNHPYYNQASPVVNGHSHYSPQIQIPRLPTPESERARPTDNQPR